MWCGKGAGADGWLPKQEDATGYAILVWGSDGGGEDYTEKRKMRLSRFTVARK
jgi:hypothetical protein